MIQRSIKSGKNKSRGPPSIFKLHFPPLIPSSSYCLQVCQKSVSKAAKGREEMPGQQLTSRVVSSRARVQSHLWRGISRAASQAQDLISDQCLSSCF